MPAPTAPGADWRAARADYERGIASIAQIAARCGVTPQAVTNRRAREGWAAPLAQPRAIQRVSEQWLDRCAALGITDQTHQRRSRLAAAALAQAVSRGLPDDLAAPLAGMTRETFALWRDEDEKLRQLLDEAKADFANSRIQNLADAADRGDAQTVRWWLERHAATREHFRPAESAGGLQIHVAFGFMPQLPEASPAAPVITVDAVEDGAELQIDGPKSDK